MMRGCQYRQFWLETDWQHLYVQSLGCRVHHRKDSKAKSISGLSHLHGELAHQAGPHQGRVMRHRLHGDNPKQVSGSFWQRAEIYGRPVATMTAQLGFRPL